MEHRRRVLGWLKGGRTIILAGLLCAGGSGICFRPVAAWGQSPVDSTAAAEPAGSLLIPAYAFDRGRNVETCTTRYADAGPMVGNVRYPTGIEYDIDFPVTAQYTLNVRYAAQSARPVELFFDGENLGQCCRTTTGGWNTSRAAWERTCGLSITKGKHTVKLYRNGSRKSTFPTSTPAAD